MRRRNFVNNSILGLIGTHLSQNIFSPVFKASPHALQWFYQYLKLTSLSSLSLKLAEDPILNSTITSALHPLDRLGYTPFHKPVFYHDGQYCIVPYKLQNGALTEVNLSFFMKKPGLNWQLLTQWNGFELEAVVHAGNSLSDGQENIGDLILPVGSMNKSYIYPEKFITKAGKVYINIQLPVRKAQTTITIEKGGELIFHKQIESEHCLTTGISYV